MNKHSSLSQYYLKFRKSQYFLATIYSGINIICIIIIFIVLLPLWQNLSDINNQADHINGEITMLKKNISYLNNLDENQLSENYTLAGQAVPTTRDFTGTIEAITAAALRTNVNLQDFTFAIGDVKQSAPVVGENQAFTINATIKGTPTDAANFLRDVKQKLPLITATNLTVQTGLASFTLQIAVTPYTQQLPDLKQVSLALPSSDTSLLQTFSNWNLGMSVASVTTATNSGSLPPF